MTLVGAMILSAGVAASLANLELRNWRMLMASVAAGLIGTALIAAGTISTYH